MQELHVSTRYQKFTESLQCYRNLEQWLIRSPHVTIMVTII